MLKTNPLRFKLDPSFLLKSIHHPDPLTRQQTQRFLDAVTTSFRRNLDKEHGWLPDEQRPAAAGSTTSSPLQPATGPAATTQGVDGVTDGGRRLPTDHHLSSILSSPLFRAAAPPLVRNPTPATIPSPVTKRDPIVVFEEAALRGLMTLQIATGCLKAKHNLIQDSQSTFLDDSQSTSNEAFSGFDVSNKVLAWLRSAGLDRNLQFALHPNFVAAFMPFLVAEGREEVVWTWLARLMADDGPVADSSFAAARVMLLFLVRAKTVGVECVDSAFESIIQASETYRKDPRHGRLLGKAWRDVAWRTTTLSWQKPSPSASLFDSYLDIAELLYPSSTKLPVAHLHLHHPTAPSHDLAVDYFEEAKKKDKIGPTDRMRREAMMGVDAVSHLGLVGKLEEARRLLNFIHHRYSFFFHKPQGKPDDLLAQLEPA
ncbi:unnamed protein product [Parascedosporium putredinis]|uniref:Uncharacterized protein n=1 Tax=Parascedosporium putredinis TaxID=1442378 RepID=A0A9P1H8E1_9PEZI|nr:unnamed protein product [Parascedosporium putredinis]CAI7999342.1 unnamed protein product [Parascedosporium putredinis]